MAESALVILTRDPDKAESVAKSIGVVREGG
jgi:hypothetical protein